MSVHSTHQFRQILLSPHRQVLFFFILINISFFYLFLPFTFFCEGIMNSLLYIFKLISTISQSFRFPFIDFIVGWYLSNFICIFIISHLAMRSFALTCILSYPTAADVSKIYSFGFFLLYFLIVHYFSDVLLFFYFI